MRYGPVWLTLRRVAVLGVAWPALAVGAFVFQVARPWMHAPMGAAALGCATVVAEVTLASAIGAAATRIEAPRVAFGILSVTAIQSVIAGAWGFVLAVIRGYGPLPGMAIGCFASFAGVLLAFWQAVIAGFAGDWRLAPSHDGRDRALVSVALGIACPAGLIFAVGCLWAHASWRAGFPWLVPTVIAPLVMAAIAHINLRTRRRWVAAVREGRIPGWRIVDHAARDNVRVLVRIHAPRAPFRDAETTEPVAIVSDKVVSPFR
jgi:hypothetical protein